VHHIKDALSDEVADGTKIVGVDVRPDLVLFFRAQRDGQGLAPLKMFRLEAVSSLSSVLMKILRAFGFCVLLHRVTLGACLLLAETLGNLLRNRYVLGKKISPRNHNGSLRRLSLLGNLALLEPP